MYVNTVREMTKSHISSTVPISSTSSSPIALPNASVNCSGGQRHSDNFDEKQKLTDVS